MGDDLQIGYRLKVLRVKAWMSEKWRLGKTLELTGQQEGQKADKSQVDEMLGSKCRWQGIG